MNSMQHTPETMKQTNTHRYSHNPLYIHLHAMKTRNFA